MNDPPTYFITWTCYGAWLPGDRRGWRKKNEGEQQPKAPLEQWCRDRMLEEPVILAPEHREAVETVCHQHATIRNWFLHAVSARSNHVHVVVTADAEPKKVRDQLKANATRVLRSCPNPITNDKVWTRGGDIEIVDGEDGLERVLTYVLEAQDRMDRPR